MSQLKQYDQLPNPKVKHVLSRILVLQPLLAKETGIEYPRKLFNNTTFMMSLGHAAKWSMDLRQNDLSKKTERLTRKPSSETSIDDVVVEVLKSSHRDGSPEQRQILSTLTREFYQNIDQRILHNSALNPEFHERSQKVKHTDLLRGLDVFIEVANDRYDFVYDADILQPARRLAAWMLTIT